MNGEIIVNVCMGTGGIAAGAEMVMKAFEEEFAAAGVENATVQNRCKLHKVGCRGFCAKDVLVDINVNGEVSTYQYIQPEMVKRLVKEHVIGQKPITEWMAGDDYHVFHDNQTKIILHDLGKINPESIDDYLGVNGYDAARKALTTMTPEEVIVTVKNSGLRGRGGGGFPTGLKWSLCAANEADQRYVICNADEGDPGSYSDRYLLEHQPIAVLVGLIIAGYVTGADRGVMYIRYEYPELSLIHI